MTVSSLRYGRGGGDTFEDTDPFGLRNKKNMRGSYSSSRLARSPAERGISISRRLVSDVSSVDHTSTLNALLYIPAFMIGLGAACVVAFVAGVLLVLRKKTVVESSVVKEGDCDDHVV